MKIPSKIFPGVLEVSAYLLFSYEISPGRKINNTFFFFARLRLRVYFGQTVAMWWYSTKVPAHHGFPLLQLRTKKERRKEIGVRGEGGKPKIWVSPLLLFFCGTVRYIPPISNFGTVQRSYFHGLFFCAGFSLYVLIDSMVVYQK